MKILILGASGATGRQAVKILLKEGHEVCAIVRPEASLKGEFWTDPNLTVVRASLLNMSNEALDAVVVGSRAVLCFLGHNLTFKGLFLPPRRLVRDAVKKVCESLMRQSGTQHSKVILMNTTGNRNKDLSEPRTLGEKLVIGLLRVLLPPQADNESAAEYLRVGIGQNHPQIQWVAVRPDSLIDMDVVSAYETHPSPLRSPIFDAGKTSRINTAHFMSSLAIDEKLWSTWMGQMPVLYNSDMVDPQTKEAETR